MDLAEALKPSSNLLTKLGSIIVHFQEMVDSGGHAFDQMSLDHLLNDPEVVAWMAAMDGAALLPLRRDRR